MAFISRAIAALIAAAVVAGRYKSFAAAQKAMCGLKATTFKPNKIAQKVYQQLYILYKKLHDAFGVKGNKADISGIMKDLLAVKEKVNA